MEHCQFAAVNKTYCTITILSPTFEVHIPRISWTCCPEFGILAS